MVFFSFIPPFETLCVRVIENLQDFNFWLHIKTKVLKKKSKLNLVLNPLTCQKLAGALDHLAIGLVDNKYTKLGKIGEKVLLILGLSYIKIPLTQWYMRVRRVKIKVFKKLLFDDVST